jgi:hypothetical protein
MVKFNFYIKMGMIASTQPPNSIIKLTNIFSINHHNTTNVSNLNICKHSDSGVTTAANKVVGKVHDPKFHMPVILDDYNEKLWLDKELSPTALLSLCQPYPG